VMQSLDLFEHGAVLSDPSGSLVAPICARHLTLASCGREDGLLQIREQYFRGLRISVNSQGRR
jgi:hypothetical protein